MRPLRQLRVAAAQIGALQSQSGGMAFPPRRSTALPPRNPVEEIFARFALRGGERYGEDVTQLEHALQCAGLAVADGAGEALVAAALLHDIGQLFDGRGEAAEKDGLDAHHEAFGARWLRRWFGPAVTVPIALHVAAKRHLCAVEPGYEQGLSEASRLSLRLQGGRFTAEESRGFTAAPFAADAIRLRRYDDTGKIDGLATPTLEAYAELLTGLRIA
jgi:phosphonate degradation associated HDIG domain protein